MKFKGGKVNQKTQDIIDKFPELELYYAENGMVVFKNNKPCLYKKDLEKIVNEPSFLAITKETINFIITE